VNPVALHGTYDVVVDGDGTLLVGDSSNRVLRIGLPQATLSVAARLRFPVEVAIDPRLLHFFDLETGVAIPLVPAPVAAEVAS